MLPIIICGPSCTGKTTVADLVARQLKLPEGGRPSAGALFRHIAEVLSMSLAELRSLAQSDPSIDSLIDERMLGHIRRHEPVVLDSRVLAWLAHKEKLAAFKVLLTVSPTEAGARFAKREHCSQEAALDHITNRDREDVNRLGPLYSWDPRVISYYDLVLDSETHDPKLQAALIVRAASK